MESKGVLTFSRLDIQNKETVKQAAKQKNMSDEDIR
jgi:hypothetical protein